MTTFVIYEAKFMSNQIKFNLIKKRKGLMATNTVIIQ